MVELDKTSCCRALRHHGSEIAMNVSVFMCAHDFFFFLKNLRSRGNEK